MWSWSEWGKKARWRSSEPLAPSPLSWPVAGTRRPERRGRQQLRSASALSCPTPTNFRIPAPQGNSTRARLAGGRGTNRFAQAASGREARRHKEYPARGLGPVAWAASKAGETRQVAESHEDGSRPRLVLHQRVPGHDPREFPTATCKASFVLGASRPELTTRPAEGDDERQGGSRDRRRYPGPVRSFAAIRRGSASYPKCQVKLACTGPPPTLLDIVTKWARGVLGARRRNHQSILGEIRPPRGRIRYPLHLHYVCKRSRCDVRIFTLQSRAPPSGIPRGPS